MEKFKIIGLMSGTSLDGLDIAYAEFWQEGDDWKYVLGPCKMIEYNDAWQQQLSILHKVPAEVYVETDHMLGRYFGTLAKTFIDANKLVPDVIASHGHTVFHQPQHNFTGQIGHPAQIHAVTGVSVIGDFRSLDVALGGQGAPLVPLGDRHLFGEYTHCLNLGGIANISFETGAERLAFDICPANMALNKLAKEKGQLYDDGGIMAKSGEVDSDLLNELDELPYYSMQTPKSLSKEWFETELVPVLDNHELSIEDKLATCTEHIVGQIAHVLRKSKAQTTLVTGGGALNTHLIEQLSGKSGVGKIVVPETKLIHFKEALIFAFLGMLRLQGANNVLSTVTGAIIDNMGGCLYGKGIE